MIQKVGRIANSLEDGRKTENGLNKFEEQSEKSKMKFIRDKWNSEIELKYRCIGGGG